MNAPALLPCRSCGHQPRAYRARFAERGTFVGWYYVECGSEHGCPDRVACAIAASVAIAQWNVDNGDDDDAQASALFEQQPQQVQP